MPQREQPMSSRSISPVMPSSSTARHIAEAVSMDLQLELNSIGVVGRGAAALSSPSGGMEVNR
jgi:hypothetical protein